MYNKLNIQMSPKSCPKTIIYITAITLFVSGGVSFVFSQESDLRAANRGYVDSRNIPETKKETVVFKESTAPQTKTKEVPEVHLSEIQKQARAYRDEGLRAQEIGNLEQAVVLYQKAIELDPAYAIAYNDLGIIYEALGAMDRAEGSYLKSIKVGPTYMSPYTNLAIFYENKRDLDKAAFYWEKRANLGSHYDPWTQKARQRLNDINVVLKGLPSPSDTREQEVIGLTKDVIKQKAAERQDAKTLAKTHFQKAKLYYEQQDEVTALKEAIDAHMLDPSNKEIEEFIEKVQHRLLSQ